MITVVSTTSTIPWKAQIPCHARLSLSGTRQMSLLSQWRRRMKVRLLLLAQRTALLKR